MMTTYLDYMTDPKKYDRKFAKVDGLRWHPWIGKHYHKTRIFVLGYSTGWCTNDVKTNRKLVAWVCSENAKPFDYESNNPQNARSFKIFSNMFINETGCDRATFWKSVAFMNFCQRPVKNKFDWCECPEDSLKAYEAVLRILDPKPTMVLAWGMKAIESMNSSPRKCEKLSGAYPRIIDGDILVAAIRHPSTGFSAEKWIKFLRADPASKEPIEDFIRHLKQQPTT